MDRTYPEVEKSEVISTFRDTLAKSKIKNPTKQMAAMNAAVAFLEKSTEAEQETINELREAVKNCEEMRRTIDEYKASKHIHEALQAEVLSLKTRLKITEDNAWSTYAVIFISVLAFFAGMTFSMICIPVLTK